MMRREILTAVELAMAASALTAATYGLVRASYDPYAAVAWVPIAIIGVGTALSLVGLAAVLFVGRAGLMLADDAVRAWRLRQEFKTLPPSFAGRHASPNANARVANAWQHRFSAEVVQVAREASGAAELPPTLRMPVEEMAAAAGKSAGKMAGVER